MWIKRVLAYLIGFIFLVAGGILGAKGAGILLCWIFGGKERVSRFLSSTLSFRELGTVEFIGIILVGLLGASLGVLLWVIIVWKTGWLAPDEIMKFIEGGKK